MIAPDKKIVSLTWADLYVIGKILMITEQNDEYVRDLHMPAYAVMVLSERIKEKKLQLF